MSAPEADFVDELVKKIFDRRLVSFAKLTLVPKSFEVIPDPEFVTQMKYVCISPMVPQEAFLADESGNLPEPLDPRTQEFSDMFYDAILDRMEKAGFTEEQIANFAEFEIIPDPTYIQKIADTHKKFARIYKNNLEPNDVRLSLAFHFACPSSGTEVYLGMRYRLCSPLKVMEW